MPVTFFFKCFVDAGFSRILKRKYPNSIILTDYNDLEAYLYEKKYITKFIKIGLKTDKITSDEIIKEISNARKIALLRICSIEKKYKLPFQKTNRNFKKYYSLKKGLDVEKYINVLIQNSIDKEEFKVIYNSYANAENKYSSIIDRDLIHGKDALMIIKIIASSFLLKLENIESLFWMSFDSSDIKNHTALKQIEDFIQ